jgi:hypothetical protein
MAFKQEVNVPLVVTVGIVSGILLLVIVIGTQAWYQSEEQSEIALKAAEAAQRAPTNDFPYKTFAALKVEQQGNLTAPPHWVDPKTKAAVTIPIDQAIDYLANNGGKLPTTQP